MTILLLLLFVTLVPHVNRFDVLERNTYHDECGRVVMVQFIGWDWDHTDGKHRCQWWTRAGEEIPTRTADGWRLVTGGKRIVARSYRETWTVGDPEVEDRAAWPVEKRRGAK